jgi:4-amino-4-deoxy-L-arabinose transferase-like glycosyltransferase
MGSRLNIGQLILIFALAALPFAATFAVYYPDERHYTDGALMMLKNGDWFVPHTATGALRLEKPVFAYWAVATSWLVFGVNALAARLPFLLASCGTLWLTHRLARKLTGNDRTALLAAVILASHPQFFLCSVRSMPDALMVFFVTLSAFGFLRLIVLEELTAGAFWMAYGGAALAVLSKGLLGAGIVLFAWSFAAGRQRNWRAVKKLIHPPSMACAAALAGGLLVLTFWNHGAAVWNAFFDDQVVGNIFPSQLSSVRNHWWSPFWRVPVYALFLVFNFLPWSATVVESLARRKSPAAENVPPSAQKFILAWTTVLVLGFALGTNVSVRYLLPAAPLLAVLIVAWLQGAEQMKLVFSVRRIFAVALAALVLADAAALVVDSQWPLPAALPVLTCGIFLFGIAALGIVVWRKKSFSAAEGLGLAMLLGALLFFSAAMPLLLPDRAQQIAAALQRESSVAAGPVLLVGDLKLASRVRVLLGKNWTVTQTDELNPADMESFTRILIPEKDAGQFLHLGWKMETVAAGFGVPPWAELWAALKSRQLPEALARHGQKICLATRE